MILGVEYLHYQKIIHGDLKPENLLLAEGDVIKVADLGVCNEFLGDDSSIDQRTATGTPAFRAPETLSGQKIYFDGKSADIWSLGVTLFAFLFGDVPFKSQAIPVLYEQIKSEDVTFPTNIAISDDVKDLIAQMLTKDPEKRINMQQIKVKILINQIFKIFIKISLNAFRIISGLLQTTNIRCHPKKNIANDKCK